MKKNIFRIYLFILTSQLTYTQQPSQMAQGASTVVNVISGLADQFLQQSNQQSQQYIQMLQQQKMLQQLTPQLSPPNATFPNCQLPVPLTPPNGACLKIEGPDAFLMAQNIQGAAIKYSSFFDLYLAKTGTGVGLSCIDQSIKKLAQSLSAKSNQLQTMIDNIKKGQQFIAEEASTLKKQMEVLGNELYGGGEDIEEKTKDYTALFPGCRGIIPSDALNNPKGGLVGIRSSIDNTGMRTAAQNLITNYGIYNKEIEELTERIKADVNEVGIDTFFAGGATQSKWYKGGLTQFGGVEQIILEKKKELDLKRAGINQDLSEVDYSPPQMDKKFTNKMKEFASGASVYFKKKFINECILGGNPKIKRLGLETSELLNNIRNKNLDPSLPTFSLYKSRLNAILNSPGFIDEKISKLNSLDEGFSNSPFFILYRNAQGEVDGERPSEYFKSMIKTCEVSFESGGTLDKDNPGGYSYKEKVENAQRALNELNQINLEFTASLGNLIKDKLLTCSNSPLKEGQCSPDIMSPSNNDFCLKRASFCADRTRSCFMRADNLIKDRTAKMKSFALLYNKKIEALIVKQESELNQIKILINTDIEALKQMFPGALFNAPTDLVVPMPAPIDTPLGVRLRGGGSLGFLMSLPEQLNKIKKSMEEQGNRALEEAQQYYQDQSSQMQGNKEAWQSLVKACDQAISEFNKNYSDLMGKAMQEEMKISGEIGEFCYKYERLGNSNPLAGCDGDNSPSKLYNDAFKVAGYLNPSVIANLGEYEKLCAQSQNNHQLGSEGDKRPELIKLCELTGDNWKDVIAIKKEEILRKIQDPKLKAHTKSFLEAKEPINHNLPPYLFRQAANLKLLETQKAQGREALIKDLNGDVETREEIKLKEVKNKLLQIKKKLPDNNSLDKAINSDTLEILKAHLEEKIKPREKLESEMGSNIAEELYKAYDSVTNDDLPESPSGVGTTHQGLFKKGDDENNLCLALKNHKISEGISTCAENRNFENCFKKQINLTQDDLDPGLFDILSKKLSSISNYEDPESVAQKWSAIGENSRSACASQGNQERRGKEPSQEGISEPIENLEKMLEGKEI